MHWRKEINIQAIFEEDFTEYEIKFPIHFDDPPDKYGRPGMYLYTHTIYLYTRNNNFLRLDYMSFPAVARIWNNGMYV